MVLTHFRPSMYQQQMFSSLLTYMYLRIYICVTFWGLSYIIGDDGVSYIFGGKGLS